MVTRYQRYRLAHGKQLVLVWKCENEVDAGLKNEKKEEEVKEEEKKENVMEKEMEKNEKSGR